MICHVCEKEMTEEDLANYYATAERCCNGFECGCMGAPVDPPVCIKCIKEYEE